MRDTKAFASLSSGLLARKGQARPAMRPQGFSHGMAQAEDLGWNDMGHDVPRVAGARLPAGLAGPQAVPTDATVETPVALPEVLRQQDEIAREYAEPVHAAIMPAMAVPGAAATVEEIAPVEPSPSTVQAMPVVAPAPARKSRSRAAPVLTLPVAAPREAGRKAAFTLRLTTDRHLLLRLACAVQNRSAQLIVTEALDRLLADLPDVARLAASLPHTD